MTEPWKIVDEDDTDLPMWPVTLGSKPGPFAKDLQRLADEGKITVERVDTTRTFSEQLHDLLREALPQYDLTPDPGPSEPVEVRKAQAYTPVSCCILTDSTGINHCTHPAPPRPSWANRTRWHIRSWWSGLRLRAGSWIAGVDLDREDGR